MNQRWEKGLHLGVQALEGRSWIGAKYNEGQR